MKCPKCHFEYRANGECFCSDRANGSNFNFINDIPEHYNRGLGKVIRGRKQYVMELKAQNKIEVGNEKKYVSPEYNEKLQERKTEQMLKAARPEAYKILAEARGNSQWN